MTDARRFDAVVVGGGHNGLVCAAYLARGGLRTALLERRDRVGGAVGTHELRPGIRVPDLASSVGRLRPSIVRDLGLRDHRLRFVQPDARLTALSPGRRPLTLWGDPSRTAAGLAAHSARDAQRFPEFDAQVRALGGLLGRLMSMTPPDPASPVPRDALEGARLALRYRGLDPVDARAFLRVLPMPVADYAEDWFETDALRALLCWRGVRYSRLGPRDAGSAQTFLAESAGTTAGAAGELVAVMGGPGALAEALASAARRCGVEIITEADVKEITTDEGSVDGVTLADGRRIEALAVVSGLDPKRTLLELIDPLILGPVLGWQAGNLRLGGAVSKVDFALADLPTFPDLGTDDALAGRLRGRLVIGASVRTLDRMADALKARRIADEPILEVTIPSALDSSLVDGAPTNGAARARHVMSVLVQGTPYARRDGASWDAERDALGDRVMAQLEEAAPGIGELVIDRRVVTPLDLERDYGMTEGHPLHGEPGLDQWFAWRPILGLARYRMPIDGLYLCGSGAHPGGGVTGWPGRNAAREILADRRRRRWRH